jgi:hypothetical protein
VAERSWHTQRHPGQAPVPRRRSLPGLGNGKGVVLRFLGSICDLFRRFLRVSGTVDAAGAWLGQAPVGAQHFEQAWR